MQITKRQLLQIIKEESEALGGKSALNESMLKRLWHAMIGSEPEPKQLQDLEGRLGDMTVEELMAYMKELESGGMVQDTGDKPLPGKGALKKMKSFTSPTGGMAHFEESDEEEGEPLEESIRKIVRRHALKESIRGVVRKHTAKKRRRPRRR